MFWKKDLNHKESSQSGGRINLDYASATPVLPEVALLMDSLQKSTYGNASAIHNEGVLARKVVEDARSSVARTLGIRPDEVVFTASGSESNNLAISGYLEAILSTGRKPENCTVLTTALEHPSVTAVLEYWKGRGVRIELLSVDEYGRILLPSLESSLSPDVVLITFAYANSEVGTIQSVRRLSRIVRAYELENECQIALHVDACQAPLWLPCQPRQLDVDLMSLDTGKCNGPKGVGILTVHSRIKLNSIIHGGGQEGGLRAGTEAVPLLAGAALSLKIAQSKRDERSLKVSNLAAALKTSLAQHFSEIYFNGPEYTSENNTRLPHNVHISLPGLDTEFAVIVLDSKGIAASTKSACSGAGGGESAVIRAISGDATRALSTIRFTIDPNLTLRDMEYVAQTLSNHVIQMKKVDHKSK